MHDLNKVCSWTPPPLAAYILSINRRWTVRGRQRVPFRPRASCLPSSARIGSGPSCRRSSSSWLNQYSSSQTGPPGCTCSWTGRTCADLNDRKLPSRSCSFSPESPRNAHPPLPARKATCDGLPCASCRASADSERVCGKDSTQPRTTLTNTTPSDTWGSDPRGKGGLKRGETCAPRWSGGYGTSVNARQSLWYAWISWRSHPELRMSHRGILYWFVNHEIKLTFRALTYFSYIIN